MQGKHGRTHDVYVSFLIALVYVSERRCRLDTAVTCTIPTSITARNITKLLRPWTRDMVTSTDSVAKEKSYGAVRRNNSAKFHVVYYVQASDYQTPTTM